MSTFINPFTDFGFKKLFGQESALPRLKSDSLVSGAFDEAKLLGMSKMEQLSYEQSLKIYRDLTNVVDTAYEDGAADMQKMVKEAQQREEQAQRENEQAQRENEKSKLRIAKLEALLNEQRS